MGRSLSFRNLARTLRIAQYCEENNVSTSEGLEQAADIQAHTAARRDSRREFLANLSKLAVVGAVGGVASPLRLGLAGPPPGPAVRVAIVGAGLAGLACGDELHRNGIKADLYDATNRVGGRCFSLAGFFPGQVAERGGEFIDNLHKTLFGYAKRFQLEHWPTNPFVKGSYTCNHPGYFTTIADNEAKPVGNLYFAGEHTSSFYEFQGFMEGAVLSGVRALHDIKVGTLQ